MIIRGEGIHARHETVMGEGERGETAPWGRENTAGHEEEREGTTVDVNGRKDTLADGRDGTLVGVDGRESTMMDVERREREGRAS